MVTIKQLEVHFEADADEERELFHRLFREAASQWQRQQQAQQRIQQRIDRDRQLGDRHHGGGD